MIDRALMPLALVISLVFAGSAAAGSKQKVVPSVLPNFDQPDLSAANNGYTLSAEELKYDCRKLTGHMQVRILQLRSTRGDTKTTELSRNMQQAATPWVAGTTRGINPDGDNARDLSMLKALNAQLAAKNCPVYDLDTDLKPGATGTPHPVPKPKAGVVRPAAAPAAAVAPAAKAP